MPATKIVDEQEVLGWFAQGRTYAWMVSEYRDRYGIETVPSMWSNFRRRRRLERRTVRDDDLIPWHVAEEHRWSYPVQMLRLEARRRAGRDIGLDDTSRLEVWILTRRREGTVVHYDPEQGFTYVPRGPGDHDLIREPARKTTKRPNAA